MRSSRSAARPSPTPTTVATWDGAKSLVDQAVSEFGSLDVVINNAGILRDGSSPPWRRRSGTR